MAAIVFQMNNLTVNISGVAGMMEVCTYTNLDPIEYVFKIQNLRTHQVVIYTCCANKTAPTAVEGWRHTKTDESNLSFLGGRLPA